MRLQFLSYYVLVVTFGFEVDRYQKDLALEEGGRPSQMEETA